MKISKKISNLMLATVITLSSYTYSNAQQNLETHFIDVGQGDSTYVELPDGTDVLIDAGNTSKGNTVVDYLKKQEKNIDIEYLIATHPDADHIGGMQEVFKQFNVKKFYYPYDAPHDTKTWNNVLSLANQEGCNIYDAKTGTTLNIGGTTVKFIQPNKDYSDNNEDSVITLVDYKDTEILLTGDAEAQAEKDMINSNLVGDVDVLKVGHHGSNSSTTQELLNKTKPEDAVISVGAGNNYGHPTSNVLNRLNSIGAKIWRTDLDRNIVVTSDGTNIVINGIPSGGSSTTTGEWKLENGNWYFYKNGAKQLGWIMDNGVWYYTNSSGVMQTGWQLISGSWYYLQPNGAMLTGWLSENGVWYYLNDNGTMATGWKQVGYDWYYLNGNGTMATGWKQVDGDWYYLNSNGTMATGWKQIGYDWYYLNGNGTMATGWKQVDGDWYYLNSNGTMATGWKQVGYDWYYLESSGAMKTGWLKDNNKSYYLQSSGAMATGWNWLGKSSSYVNDYGITITETSYDWYYFYNSGEMATYTTIDGWYIDENGVATPEYENDDNWEDDSWEDDSWEPQEIVYITPGGKSYHNSRNCTALKRSTTILEVSYSEAINKGKSDPCNLCVR